MEERIWAALHQRHGVCRDAPDTWQAPVALGLQSLRTHHVFESNGGRALHAALDDLIHEGCWQKPRHWGQFLVSFPVGTGAPSSTRSLWHTDFPYCLPADRVVGALVFSFLGEVPARTGGTLVMAGSHRLIRDFIGAHAHLRKPKMKVARQALMNSDPWLKALGADGEDWVDRSIGAEHAIGDVQLQVVELTDEPGDVVIGHPWLLHSPTPNRGEGPRFMRVQRILTGS